MRVVERIAQNMFICAPHASQVAALWLRMECNRRDCRPIWQCISPETGKLDVGGVCPRPVLPISRRRMGRSMSTQMSRTLTDDSRAFAAEISGQRAGVAVTPGLDFDPVRGQYARCAFPMPEARPKISKMGWIGCNLSWPSARRDPTQSRPKAFTKAASCDRLCLKRSRDNLRP